MEPVSEAEALVGRGLDGCRHAKKKPNSKRQVLLVDDASRALLKLAPGALKENVLVEGLPLNDLPAGQRLRLGSAVVEITGPCTPCWKLDKLRPGLLSASWGKRGQLARVVAGGRFRLGDTVSLAGVNPDAPKPINPKLP